MFTRRKANGILCRYCGASENPRGLYEDGRNCSESVGYRTTKMDG